MHIQKLYVNFINSIENKNIIKLHPRYSPKLISKNVHFSISSPFTTAAFYQTIKNFNFFYFLIKYCIFTIGQDKI